MTGGKSRKKTWSAKELKKALKEEEEGEDILKLLQREGNETKKEASERA